MAKITIEVPDDLHPDSVEMLRQLSEAMAGKLLKSQVKYGYNNDWKVNDWEAECKYQLLAHVAKGDPLDVAIYAGFCHSRGWTTSMATPKVFSYQDVQIEFNGKKAQLTHMPNSYSLTCHPIHGWQLLNNDEVIGGEFHNNQFQVKVGEVVICNTEATTL